MRRILAGLAATFLSFMVNAQAHALVFPLSPGDAISVYGAFLCAKTLPCEGGDLYEFTVSESAAFQTTVTLDNFTDVTLELFPAASPGTPLQTWIASSPGAVTPLTLSYAGLAPGTVYNFTIFGSVPAVPGAIKVGKFQGWLGVTAAPVSAVPLPGAFWLFGSGLAALLLGFARRR